MGIELAKAYVRVRADASRVSGDLNKAKPEIMSATSKLGTAMSGSLAAIGIGAGFAGAAMAIGRVTVAGETFNREMRSSLAIMGDVGTALRSDMRDAAFEAASVTQFSAAQSAKSFYYLASAGLDAKQSIAALPQVAMFAQAGMFDMARATDLATDAQSALGLTVKDPIQNLKSLTRVTDVLVKANTLANASVEQFSLALTTKAGAAAKIVGKDIEETVAVLAAFADQGLKSSEAGTAFNIVMRDLQTRAIQNKNAFAEAGLAVFDSAGKMRNMADVVGDLENILGGLSPEMKKITLMQMGFADKSLIFLQTLLGTSEKIREYEKELRKAGGTTKDVADKQLTPLQKGWAEISTAVVKASAAFMQLAGPVLETVMRMSTVVLKVFMANNAALAKLVVIIAVVVGAFKAWRLAMVAAAAAKAVLLGMSGPMGWAALAAGIAIGTAAIAGMNEVLGETSEAADEVASSIKRMAAAASFDENLSIQELRNYIKERKKSMEGGGLKIGTSIADFKQKKWKSIIAGAGFGDILTKEKTEKQKIGDLEKQLNEKIRQRDERRDTIDKERLIKAQLDMRNRSAKQLADERALLREKRREAEKQQEDAKAAIQRMGEAERKGQRTPDEILKEESKRIHSLFARGGIDTETAARALTQAKQRAGKFKVDDKEGFQQRFAGIPQMGRIIQDMLGKKKDDKQAEMVKLMEDDKKTQKEGLTALKNLGKLFGLAPGNN